MNDNLLIRTYNRYIQKKIKRKQVINDEKQFKSDCEEYTMKNQYAPFSIDDKEIYPILDDRDKQAGYLDKHYFIQDIVMANEIYKIRPKMHYDIGSRVDGFIAHLLSFDQEVTLLDFRPLDLVMNKLHFIQTDATLLNEIEDESLDSLSSLHAIEHFGLGRYGDEINPSACFIAMRKMQNKIKKKGMLYLSVPIGSKEKVCFNAHRVFSPKTIVNEFRSMTLVKFMYIQDMKLLEVENFEEFDWGGGGAKRVRLWIIYFPKIVCC